MTERTDKQRIAYLKAALLEIAEIAEASEGDAAAFYGMLARKALTGNEANHFPQEKPPCASATSSQT